MVESSGPIAGIEFSVGLDLSKSWSSDNWSVPRGCEETVQGVRK